MQALQFLQQIHIDTIPDYLVGPQKLNFLNTVLNLAATQQVHFNLDETLLNLIQKEGPRLFTQSSSIEADNLLLCIVCKSDLFKTQSKS